MTRNTLLPLVILMISASFAQQPTHATSSNQSSQASPQTPQEQASNQPAQPSPQPAPLAQSKSCIAVKAIGSHAFRNIMLFGVAGALVSKQQYQVVDTVNYPARVGQKFHGSDLQTVAANATRVVILDKHYTAEDLHKACQ